MASFSQLGKNIQYRRKELGLTQDDLSDKSGLSYSTLAKLERGAIKNPSVFTVADIASSLDCKIEELLGDQFGWSTGANMPSNDESIKFVFSDVNGVMVRFYQRAFMNIARKTHTNPEAVETTFWHYNDAVNRGEMTTADFNKAVAARLNLEPNEIDWEEEYLTTIEPIEIMHQCLAELAEDGIKIGLLTNIFPGFLDEMFKRKKLPKLPYTTIVDSSKVRAIKPENKIYEIAEEMAGVPGQNIFFIDDSRANLMAAERHGWRVMWFDDYRPEESVKRLKAAVKGQASTHPLHQKTKEHRD